MQGAHEERERVWSDVGTVRDTGSLSVADAECQRSLSSAQPGIHREQEGARARDVDAERHGGAFEWVTGADGKARRVKPGIRLLAHGVSGRVGKLRGLGNAIDPRPAAAFIQAADEAMISLRPVTYGGRYVQCHRFDGLLQNSKYGRQNFDLGEITPPKAREYIQFILELSSQRTPSN